MSHINVTWRSLPFGVVGYLYIMAMSQVLICGDYTGLTWYNEALHTVKLCMVFENVLSLSSPPNKIVGS